MKIVLGLFDGMSGGKIALTELGVKVERYYSSEIDPSPIKIADKNFPEDSEFRLGDINNWREWDIDWKSVDLILAGSPCQDLSNIKTKGKGLKGSKSSLFFVFVDILNHVKALNPNVNFLLENVRMKHENLVTVSEIVGVEPM